MLRTTLFFISSLILSSVSFAQQALGPESLIGHMITPEGIQVQVHSGGCTGKRNFKIEKSVKADNSQVITFVRTAVDPCLGFFTYGKLLSYSYEELGIQVEDRIEVGNPHVGVTVY